MLSHLVLTVLLMRPMQSTDAYAGALSAFQAGRYEEAIAILSKIPDGQPAVDNLRALALSGSKRYAEAIASIRQARQLAPENPSYAYNHGLILFDMRDFAGARRVYEEALRKSGENPGLLSALAEALVRLHEYDEAEKRVRQALALEPTNATSWVIAARLYYSIGDREKFARAAQAAFSAAPQNAQASYFYGLYLKEQAGKRDEGAAHIRKSVELDPGFAEGHRALGNILMQQDRWAEAVQSLERATARDPEDAEAFFLLSRAYRRTGQTAKAEAALAKYASLRKK